ncbi:MAG: hypothetical protein JXM68_07550, partial [Sedimentisphaerales bacterium]|nr:hypothetical protein [Sedimentisphaerales bacterium]
SCAGGVPSPIFPDGRMLSLPIPDKNSKIRYQDISWQEYNVGNIVADLTNSKVPASHFAHLDPDINPDSINREKGWRPIFGQEGSSQSHLENHNVGIGDIFLFFGLFREINNNGNMFHFNKSFPKKHVIWGWFQIDNNISVAKIDKKEYEWALHHPHFHRNMLQENNTIYIAKDKLEIPGLDIIDIKGSGAFPQYRKELQLTAPDCNTSIWKMPLWMYPKNEKECLTYHKPNRWQKFDSYALLDSAQRGQEFVLNCDYYPEAIGWINNLINFNSSSV